MAGKSTSVPKKNAGFYHHGDLKSSLKIAALQLVRKKGARGFSLNEASRLAGVTVAAPYRHFADKDALLADLAKDGFELLTVEVQESTRGLSAWKEKLVEAGLAYLRFSKHHSAYFSVMFGAGLERKLYPDLEVASRSAFQSILHLTSVAEKSPAVAMQRALAAWGLVHGLATLSADGALGAETAGRDFELLRPILSKVLGQVPRSRGVVAQAAPAVHRRRQT